MNVEPDYAPQASDDAPGNPLASLVARFDLTLGHLDRLAERQARADAQPQPSFQRFAQSVIIPANGIGIMRFAGPDQGHQQFIRSITVGGLAPNTVAAGRADVYISAMDLRTIPGGIASIGLADWRDQFPALPAVSALYGTAMEMRLNEELFVIVTGGTVAQQYVAGCTIEDRREGVTAEVWGY